MVSGFSSAFRHNASRNLACHSKCSRHRNPKTVFLALHVSGIPVQHLYHHRPFCFRKTDFSSPLVEGRRKGLRIDFGWRRMNTLLKQTLCSLVAFLVFPVVVSMESTIEKSLIFSKNNAVPQLERSASMLRVGRRVEDVGFTGTSEVGAHLFGMCILIAFILVMAFPTTSIASFKACPRVLCGLGSQHHDDPPEEIGITDEPTGRFQLCTTISSTSMGSVPLA